MGKKQIKMLEICTYIVYVFAFIVNLLVTIHTKDMNKGVLCVWIINTTIMFTLYRNEEKMGDRRVAWRDELLELQSNLINSQTRTIKYLYEKNKENKDESI